MEEKNIPGNQTEIQLVVAKLGNEEFGIEITQVQEIIKMPSEITHIPNMPKFIEGIINLRGKIVPIIHLRKRFNLEEKQISDEMRIVIASIENQSVGFVVDSVTEVISILSEKVEPVPTPIARIGVEYLNGVAKLDNRLIILLNLDKILSNLEKLSLKEISKADESEKTTTAEPEESIC